MTHQVIRNGQAVIGSQYRTMMECAAFILMKGWIDSVEIHGVIWAKGVTIAPVIEAVNNGTP